METYDPEQREFGQQPVPRPLNCIKLLVEWITNRRLSGQGLTLLALGMAGWALLHREVRAAEPDYGLWTPFYATNPAPPPTASANASPAEKEPSDYGLWGPLLWTNPAPTATPSPAASGQPSSGLARHELLGPFYYANAPRSPAHRIASPALSDYGLLGPLYYTNANPTPPPAATIAGASRDMGRRTPQLTVVQAEELIPPPTSAVSPIPTREGELPAPSAAGSNDDEDRKGLAGAEAIGDEPTDNSLQFLRASTVLLEPGQMQFDIGLAYAFADNDFPVIESGSGNIIEARFKQRQLIVPLEFRYGLTRRTQLFLNTPFGWANTEFSALGFDDFENDGGIGDVTWGLSFLLFEGQQADETDVIFTFAATAPTGGDPFGTSIAALGGPSLGDGFWALSGDLLFIETYDPLVVFYGLGTRQRFEEEFFGANVRPGGEYRCQLGVGFAVNRQVTLSTRFLASYFSETYLDGVRVPGTIQEPMSLRFAATILKGCAIVEPFATIGATDDAADAEFGIVWTY